MATIALNSLDASRFLMRRLQEICIFKYVSAQQMGIKVLTDGI